MNDDGLTITAKFNAFLSSLDTLVNKHTPLKKLSKNDIKLRNLPVFICNYRHLCLSLGVFRFCKVGHFSMP